MASDSPSLYVQEQQKLDVLETLDLFDTQREDSPSNDSHSSGAFSPIRLDDRNDELEHDADSDSSGRDVSFDPYRNKLQDRKKTKRRTSSSVFIFKKDDSTLNHVNNSQFDVVDLDLNTANNGTKTNNSAKSRREDMKWATSQSFSSSTDETDAKVVPILPNAAKSLLIDHESIDSFLFPMPGSEKTVQMETISDNSGDGDTKKISNKAVDGLLFEIYDRYHHGTDHANATESDITELSTTSVTSIYVASSFENDERPKLDWNYLETKELVELEKMVKELKRGISMLSSKLVKLLKQRDRNAHKIQENFNVLTALLQAMSQKRRVDTRIRFSFVPRPGKQGFRQWVDALKAVSRITHGIPPAWRKRTWLSLAEYFLKDVDWERSKKLCFNDRRNPDDDDLDTQIVKDLHRTGCGWFFEHDTAEDRASLKRVLLAYARWNKQIGYCQGFNVIAALILQVMEGNEEHALKVMIYLVDYVLPKNYFSNNLRALSVDMAVLRDLMQMKLPDLAQHLQRLQKEAMDQSANSVASYEPPLINIFTMQWFLTLFATCLPRNTVLRIWDAVLLEGSEVLLRVALAIWAKLGSFFDNVNSASDFYMHMGRLIQQLMTDEFIAVQKLLEVVYQMAPFPWSAAVELREKYTYDIHPFATFRSDRKGERKTVHKSQPRPASDEEDLGDVEDPMVGCLGFVASSGGDGSPVKSKPQLQQQQQQQQQQHLEQHQEEQKSRRATMRKSVPVTAKTDITKVTPGAYITDQDARAYKEQMLAKELLRETEKLDLGKLRNQYGRMRRLQQKAMLVFNADDFKDESYKVKNAPSAINHLFVDVNNVTAPPRARYRKPSNFPALKAPSKGGPPVLKPVKDPTPKFVYEHSTERKQSDDSTETAADVSSSELQRKPLERSDSFSITNPYVMHEVQDDQNESKPGTTNPGAHAEIMNKSVPPNTIKSPPVRSSVPLDDCGGDMKSTSLLYKVDKSALYPSNFKPFPSRNNNRRKMVPGK